MARTPDAEVDVTPALVRALLAEQHPDLAHLGVTEFSNGWDNAMLRLGDDLLVRAPRRVLAAELIEHEQAWLPRLAPRLPVAVPAPVRVGRPGCGYPWSWSVLPWMEGQPLGTVPFMNRASAAVEMGTLLAALHTPADDDVWHSPYRGSSLRDRAEMVAERVHAHCGNEAGQLLTRWGAAVTAPLPAGPDLWVHGDVHPLNVLLTDSGALAAVIDWGDLTAGDPACDLAVAWTGFDAADAATLRATYNAAATHHLELDALWERGWAWALHLCLMLIDFSDDHPDLAAIGAHGLARALAG